MRRCSSLLKMKMWTLQSDVASIRSSVIFHICRDMVLPLRLTQKRLQLCNLRVATGPAVLHEFPVFQPNFIRNFSYPTTYTLRFRRSSSRHLCPRYTLRFKLIWLLSRTRETPNWSVTPASELVEWHSDWESRARCWLHWDVTRHAVLSYLTRLGALVSDR